METASTPPLIDRPALALWMFQRGLKPKDAEGPLGVKTEQVRRYCLPYADPMRVVPPMAVMRRVVEWTKGAVVAEDFYPETLRSAPSEPEPEPERMVAGRRP